MAEPGGGVASGPPDCGTTIRIRAGVAADARRAMLTGAIRRRGPRWLGDSTSTTKPSTVVTPRAAGTMGVATASLCSLATRNPKATTAARPDAANTRRSALKRRAAPAKPGVTRIAPSPTGMMHIGTARTALFNWLYARHFGGAFLIRVEDTDRERSTEEAVQAIFEGLEWLGLTPDAPPVFQFERQDRPRETVQGFLDKGAAYRCYLTVEELAAERERARAEGRAFRSPWRERAPPAGENRPVTGRFRGPLDGETVVTDLIKGPVIFRNKELDDLVLLRSDGGPTYNLAVVADDHDIVITHVIRA